MSLRFQRDRVFIMASSSRDGTRSRKLRAHILNHKHKAETMNWKWNEAVTSQSLTPVCTSFSKATPLISPKKYHPLGTKYSNT